MADQNDRFSAATVRLTAARLAYAEAFIRFKNGRPQRVNGKLIPVTDELARQMAIVETKNELEEAELELMSS